MHEKDKHSHLHQPSFTMETYKAQVKPGTKVYIEVSPSHHLHGEAGETWSGQGTEYVIRLHSGDIVRVTESIIHRIHLEPLN